MLLLLVTGRLLIVFILLRIFLSSGLAMSFVSKEKKAREVFLPGQCNIISFLCGYISTRSRCRRSPCRCFSCHPSSDHVFNLNDILFKIISFFQQELENISQKYKLCSAKKYQKHFCEQSQHVNILFYTMQCLKATSSVKDLNLNLFAACGWQH